MTTRQDGGAGSANVGQGNGQQFITGACASAADCASGCCSEQADGTAQCRARVVTEQSGGSCDFGGGAAVGGNGDDAAAGGEDEAAAENANAVELDDVADGNNGTANGTETDTGDGGAAGSAGACGAIADGDGAANVGLGDGSQFITGQCFSPADCASGCCADQGDGTARCGAQFPTENERGQTCDFSCDA